MHSWQVLAGVIGVAVLVAPQLSAAQPTGHAVAVVQQSLLAPAGAVRQPLGEGTPVSLGDVVQTGPSGEAQLLFEDDTKIVVGPNSSLLIEEALFPTEGTAERFAINALGGTFRFISGQSASSAYSIRTPTATLAVRGTIVEFAYDGISRATHVVTLDGTVDLCARSVFDLKLEGECAEVTGPCTVMTATPGGEIIKYTTEQKKREVIKREFPYIPSQAGLVSGFRADTSACPVFAFIDPTRALGLAGLGLATILIINETTKDDPPPVPVSP